MRTSYACGSVIGLASLAASCAPPLPLLRAPVVSFIFIQGPVRRGRISVVRDTPEFALPWRDSFSSARVIWGTWRLFASPDYNDFMGDYSSPYVVPISSRPMGLNRSDASHRPPPAAAGPPGVYVAP